MKNKDVGSLLVPIVNAFHRYHLTIFIVALTSGLAAAVLMLNATLQQASDTTGYKSDINITAFDQVTIDRVKQLHTSSDIPGEIILPSGRINPFTE